MSSDPAAKQAVIRVQGLGKHYAIYPRPQDRLLQALSFGRKQYYHEFWALRDVSFEVQRGECVGIIGRNGAGKSTLLQVIVGTLNPSVGTVHVEGRVAALLELGSGFNPEFTGRENISLNATILGLSRAEIAAKMEDIIATADIGEFIDQPVKVYSTGMLVRLAFAVQIQVDPDVLIIDEALAVGDARFQLKCFQRLEALKQRGTSILFVTHDIASLKRFTDRSILLDGGKLIFAGDPVQAGLEYYKLLFPPAERAAAAAASTAAVVPPPADEIVGEGHVLTLLPPYGDQYGKGGVSITSIRVSGLHAPNVFHGGDPLTVRIQYAVDVPLIEQLLATNVVEPRLMCGVRFDNQQGIVLTDVASSLLPRGTPLVINPADYRDRPLELTFRIVMPELHDGDYFLSPGIALGTEASCIPLLELVHAIHLVCINRQPVLGLMRWDYDVQFGHATAVAPVPTR